MFLLPKISFKGSELYENLKRNDQLDGDDVIKLNEICLLNYQITPCGASYYLHNDLEDLPSLQ
jgi:hypothetical protein